MSELELLEVFQGKNVELECAGSQIRGQLCLSWNPRRIVVQTKDGAVLVQGWDLIKEVR